MRVWWLLVSLVACGGSKPATPGGTGDSGGGTSGAVDADGDGYDISVDCDDTDPLIHPDAAEACDGVDQDCDGLIDEDMGDTWYMDADGDGFGDPIQPIQACTQPPDAVADNTDCDDGDSTSHPGADEQCDEVDHDCDGDSSLSRCTDCATLLANDPALADGFYTIDIDGVGGEGAFQVYCDMTRDGGGWTQFWWYEAGTGMDGVTDMLGGDLWDCDPSSDGACYASLPVSNADELLVANPFGSWAVWEFGTTVTGGYALAALNQGIEVRYLTCNDAWNPVRQHGSMSDDPYHCDENDNDGGQCQCFWYTEWDGVWSFTLDDNAAWGETAFAAGYDNGDGLGVDSFDATDAVNSTSSSLWLYWR